MLSIYFAHNNQAIIEGLSGELAHLLVVVLDCVHQLLILLGNIIFYYSYSALLLILLRSLEFQFVIAKEFNVRFWLFNNINDII